MTIDAEDRSRWPRNGQVIRRDELLRLIEENDGPEGLDLQGAVLVGEGPSDDPVENSIDLSPEALGPLAAAYREANGGSSPPWVAHRGGINLAGAQLQEAYLSWAQLQGANLEGARLQGALVQGAQLERAYLYDAQLQGAVLGVAQLQQAVLSGAQVQGANLSGAQLQGAYLWRAQLQGTDLSHAQLQGVNMYGIDTLDGASWYAALLDHTRIRRESLGKAIGDEIEADGEKTAAAYHSAKETYLLLKNNFNQIGRYEDASWAYVKEQQMEKMAFYWESRSHGWRVWRGWGSLWRWLRNWAYELLTGYGERVYMPVVWAMVVVAAFAAIYAAAGNIAAGDVGALQGQATHSPVTALVHSISAFATIGFNTLEPQGWGARLLTAVEAMFGIGLFALFVFTLGNRMSRG